MDICGNESVSNMNQFKKINISNFSFIAAALICKIITVSLIIIHILGLLSVKESNYSWIKLLDSISFVLLLVACSLQLYKWIMIILRVQFFGGGLTNIKGY